MSKPQLTVEIGAAVTKLIDGGFIRPVVGAKFALERAADALNAIDRREATGKVVLTL
jgi:NADPH2:quinone reductase